MVTSWSAGSFQPPSFHPFFPWKGNVCEWRKGGSLLSLGNSRGWPNGVGLSISLSKAPRSEEGKAGRVGDRRKIITILNGEGEKPIWVRKGQG